ncbi:MAG: acyl-CoA dehydrogenase [Comamonadaceae bacterium]|nr:MAG: acyl-CoA dehydrogenase [Comamonadaceae bacterium]
MSTPDVDIGHLRSWVGRELVRSEVIAPFPARALAALLDRDTLPDPGGELPLPWHWLHFLDTPATSATGVDGHPMRGGFLPPVPLPRRMWAAGRFAVDAPLTLGRAAEKRSRVESVELKDGKTGPLVFVAVRHVLSQHGRTCIDEVQNIVYRDAPSPATPMAPVVSEAQGTFERSFVPDALLLFRFSALTYNGHRIHDDRDYAMREEFYPGLVVHGPLQATLLLDLLARECAGRTVRSFSFRAVRPVIDGKPLALAGRVIGDRAELWTRDAEGFICVSAEAEFA